MSDIPPPLDADGVDAHYRAYFADTVLPFFTPAESAALIGDMVRDVNPALRLAVLRRYAEALGDQRGPQQFNTFMHGVIGTLAEKGIRNIFGRIDARLVADRYADFIAEVNRRDGARRVVFLVHRPYFAILREALHLARNGHRTYLLSVAPVAGDVRPVFDDAFTGIADGFASPRFLAHLLPALDSDVIHVQCMMWHYALGRLAIESARSPVVCEFYDITSFFAERDAMCAQWPSTDVDRDIALEGFIARHADAVVHRFTDEAIAEWARRTQSAPQTLQMLPYPSMAFASPDVRAERTASGGNRLVYAGGIIPRNADHPPALFNLFHQLEAFEALLDQGLSIDIFHDPHRSFHDAPWSADYRDLAARQREFRLLPGVPPHELPERIAGYDFGIALTIIDPDVYRGTPWHLRHTIPTKISAYLEAGLPVIVNAEFAAMAAFVETHGIGFSVHSSEIGGLSERLRSFDRAEAAVNVRRYNDDHGMHREIHRLIALYDKITEPA